MQRLSAGLQLAVAGLLGVSVSAGAWEQATLPISLGGLGVRDPLKVWPAARLAALSNFQQKVGLIGFPIEGGRVAPADLVPTLAAMAEMTGPQNEPVNTWLGAPATFATAEKETASQHWWTERVMKTRRTRLEGWGTARDQARLAAQNGVLGGAWLSVTPSAGAHTSLPNSDFQLLCRYWLGLPLTTDGKPVVCPQCGDTADPFGAHFVNCLKNGITRRHNALRDELSRTLHAGGILHHLEVQAQGRERPADILLVSWCKGTDLCVDLTISNPFTKDQFPLSMERVNRHLASAEKSKQDKHRASCTAMGWAAQPAAFSPWGGTGPAAKNLLAEVSKRITSTLMPALRAERAREMRQNLSVTLMREVARQLQLASQVLDDISY
jgi:hypothetical protein